MDLSVVQAFQVEIEKHVPGFQLSFKDESWSQCLLGRIVGLFNKEYMSSFTTTLGRTVYFPSRKFFESSADRSFTILSHEFVHLWDAKQRGIWFGVSYLLPQVLAVPLFFASLLGLFWSTWTLLFLVASGICLLPWPAKWRSDWESRGYTMTLAVTQWAVQSISVHQQESIAENFYGPNYYYMLRGKQKALDLIAARVAYIESKQIELDAPYRIVHAFLEERGLLRSR